MASKFTLVLFCALAIAGCSEKAPEATTTNQSSSAPTPAPASTPTVTASQNVTEASTPAAPVAQAEDVKYLDVKATQFVERYNELMKVASPENTMPPFKISESQTKFNRFNGFPTDYIDMDGTIGKENGKIRRLTMELVPMNLNSDSVMGFTAVLSTSISATTPKMEKKKAFKTATDLISGVVKKFNENQNGIGKVEKTSDGVRYICQMSKLNGVWCDITPQE